MRGIISLIGVLALLACSLPVTRAVYAQGVGNSGSISGTVTDQSGAVVPKGNVTAEDVAHGVRVAVPIDSSGEYRFSNLPPGTYDLTAQIAGFQTQVQKGVVITVGQAAILDFHLQVATSTAVVEVSAAPPVVETERGSQSNT
ncbi:MAG: carboxypeptidase-like regulatory domain-containing protein, partial [Candidatus Acidiferrales bacterium]